MRPSAGATAGRAIAQIVNGDSFRRLSRRRDGRLGARLRPPHPTSRSASSRTKNQDRRPISAGVERPRQLRFWPHRAALAVPPTSPVRAELLDAERDLVLLDGRETPFGAASSTSSGLTSRSAPSLPQRTLRRATTTGTSAVAPRGRFRLCTRRRARHAVRPLPVAPHHDNVTLDTSTGFMGWLFDDSRAMAVRRSMEACRDEVRDVSPQRRTCLLSSSRRSPAKTQRGKAPPSCRPAAAAFPRCADVAAIRATRRSH